MLFGKNKFPLYNASVSISPIQHLAFNPDILSVSILLRTPFLHPNSNTLGEKKVSKNLILTSTSHAA